jgi:hypothetical protein
MKINLVTILLVSSMALAAADPAALEAAKPKSASVAFKDVGQVEFENAPEGCVIRYTLDGKDPAATSYVYCTPIRVASTLKVKAALFKADGSANSPSTEVTCTRDADAKDGATPIPAINLDYSGAPELKEWALRAQKDADEYYPKICEKLASEGFVPPRQIMFVFKVDKGIAWTTGTKITFTEGWIKAHPKDTGTVIHELTHVLQAYKGKVPGWLTEGIADYIRWENWEPASNRRKINPQTAKYTNGYNDAAAFLMWLEKNKDKEAVIKLNAEMRKGTYSDELFNKIGGKPLGELWSDFVASLK